MLHQILRNVGIHRSDCIVQRRSSNAIARINVRTSLQEQLNDRQRSATRTGSHLQQRRAVWFRLVGRHAAIQHGLEQLQTRGVTGTFAAHENIVERAAEVFDRIGRRVRTQ